VVSPAGKNLQCSVCWEDFRLDEPVRKLPCEHVYHENCIIPWLELVSLLILQSLKNILFISKF